ALRLLACVGLGVVMPVSMTMVADWVPAARRAQMVALTFLGGSGGSIVGAYLAAALIPSFGWQTMVVVAGLVPLLIIPFYAAFVPEPPAILIKQGRPAAKLERALSVIAADADNVDRTVFTSEKAARQNVFAVVFSKMLVISTLLIWVLTLVSQGILQLVLQYAPILLQQPEPGPGLTTAESGLVVAMVGWGGIIGVVLFSFVLKRFNRFYTGAFAAVLAITGFCVIAFGSFDTPTLMVVMLLAGMGIASLPAITGAVTAVAYPAEARATGTGTALVWGRVGGMLSGATGGILIALGFTLQSIFAVLTVPTAIALAAFLGLRADSRRRARLSQNDSQRRVETPAAPQGASK
ncbi:MFS transporter, partial [Arthrobacter sp. HMWF013]|uniref:MFS transporter n=1 Tax=Arthrobacter sp. HMWF013 TaxID=2056849 RepID=UPI000D3490D1